MINNKKIFKKIHSVVLFACCALTTSIFFNNCSSGGGGGGGSGSSVAAVPAYCPYLPSKTFSSSVNVSGRAVYEYRVNGNAEVANGDIWFSPNSISGIQTFTVTVLAVNYSWTSGAIFTAQNVATNLAAPSLYAQGFVTSQGTKQVLIINKRNRTARLSLPGATGGRIQVVDQTTGGNSPLSVALSSNQFTLSGLAVAVVTLQN